MPVTSIFTSLRLRKWWPILCLSLFLLSFWLNAAKAAPTGQLPRTQVWISLDPGAHVLSGKSTILLPRNRVYWIRVKNLRITRILLGGKPIRPEIENGRLRILTVGKPERVEISFRAVFPPGEEA
ncbi:hypothetical protein, partial [Thermosulfurimonas sp.]|uniref:hypothetical protein n=1 Tax=Thermosulfurimonas sp. TaxID=2080236 RepID=UPI0025ECD4E1